MRPPQLPVIINRTAETTALRQYIRRTAAGRGGLVWLEGEPGIGKTTVLTSCMPAAEEAGFRVLWSEADELTSRMPLQALLDAMSLDERRELAAPLGGLGGYQQGADPLLATVERLWAYVDELCARSPVLWVLDELHWADETTLLTWRGLIRSAGQQPLLLACASEPVQQPEIARLRRIATGTDALVLPLPPLSPTDAAQLAAHLAGSGVDGDVERGLSDVVSRSGGNPLYIREMVDALEQDRAGKGDSLAAAITSRLRGMSTDTLKMLRTAALAGRDFSAFELATVTGSPVTDLADLIDEALAAGVLAESGSQFVFRHEVIRQELYESVPTSLRAALHRQAAQALADSGAPLERVVEQLLAAPEVMDDWTVQWLSDQGPALGRRAPHVAVQLLERAVRQVAGADPRRERLECMAADLLRIQARFGELEELAAQAAARAVRGEHAARMTWNHIVALLYVRPAQGLEVAEWELRDESRARERPPKWTARLRAQHALLLAATGNTDDAATVAKQAHTEGEQAHDQYAMACALHAMAFSASKVDIAKALELSQQAIEVLGEHPEALDLRLILMHNVSDALIRLGRRGEADRMLQQTIALAEWAAVATLPRFRIYAARYYFGAGRWDDALAELESVDEIPENTYLEFELRARGARIMAHRGERTALESYLAPIRTRKIPDDLTVGNLDELILAQALALEAEGHPERGRDLLAHYLGADAASDAGARYEWLPYLARLAMDTGEPGIAADAAALAATDAEDSREPAKIAAALRCRALAEQDAAPALESAEHYRSAAQPLDLAFALEDAAVLSGDQTAASDLLAEALDIYARLGATWDRRRAEARARRHGVRRATRSRRDRPLSGWEALTPAEVKVAHLVAQGLSNPDIGRQLYLSRRTVQSHVSHILAKLAVSSRIEIAREVQRRGTQ